MLPFVIRNVHDKLETQFILEHLYDGELKIDRQVVQVTDTGLLSIAAFLEREGLGVHYFYPYPEVLPSIVPEIAFNGYVNKLKDAITTLNPKIIGAGPYSNRYPSTLAVFRFIKHFFPDLVTVLGGQHVTFMDVQTL